MIMPSVIRDIALNAARDEYSTTRRLGGSADEATIAGCKVLLDIRTIAIRGLDVETAPSILCAPDNWWMGS